jgi:hypothetical protein
MRIFCTLICLALTFVTLPCFSLHAQLKVGAQLGRGNYMLYERVDLNVVLTNSSDSDILLNNDDGPWVRFLVTDHQGLPLASEGKATFPAITIKAGETKTVAINITPLYAIRQVGVYDASAVVNLPGKGDIISPPCRFQVLEGRKVWSETRTMDGSTRQFSLFSFAPLPDRTYLYLRVDSPDDNAVYANYYLGNIAAAVPPEVRLDAKNDLHVLQCIAMSTYLYSRTSPEGKVLHQSVFKTFHEQAPHLQELDGDAIVVAGGLEETEENSPDHLSDAQKGITNPSTPQSMKDPDSPQDMLSAEKAELPKK